MFDFFGQNIEYLKGVGPAKARTLRQEAHIYTYGDLLTYFPFRYIDKGNFVRIDQIRDDSLYVAVKGKILKAESKGIGKRKRFSAIFGDGTGTVELTWFSGLKWIEPRIKPGTYLNIFGKPSIYNHQLQFSHPEIEIIDPKHPEQAQNARIQPLYPTTETMKNRGLSPKAMAAITQNLCKQAEGSIPETLSPEILSRYRLMPREQAFIQVHHPLSLAHADCARQRLKFEELLLLQLNILKQKLNRGKTPGFVFTKVGDNFNYFYKNNLNFELTGAQKRVIKEIRADTRTGFQMNRLLQGDVGSGKTVVALMSMLLAVDNGFQACLMAPTEILARQHFASISKYLDSMKVRAALLTGSSTKKDRTVLLNMLADGQLHLLIGTHALLEDNVVFKNLGLVVIDEQHRFGVAQRAKLWNKNSVPPHILVMTATPIPRTLGMTLYGDLDLSVIDELPPNRKPVKTLHLTDHDRLKLFAFMKQEIAKGRQVYVVYPLIQESETLDLKDLMDGYESISRAFPIPDYQLSIVHGKMKAEDKEFEMRRFKKGETQIMVATTVIEVGVDVPNASVMVIENSERFGLAQLHQLRGRVGRGAEQSYCILMTADKLSKDANERINTMVATNDGFRIAEADLRLRGPGDLQGTQQSGLLALKIADIAQDENIVRAARHTAVEILQQDPALASPRNQALRREMEKNGKENFWAKIS